MDNSKKLASLLVIAFFILSNIAFADSSQNSSESVSVKQKVVSSGSYMDLYLKGEMSEDDLRIMEKNKLGNKFDEMAFQKNLLELKGRMERKESVSYEHQGIRQYYDFGPSYVGYSKEQIIYGKVFIIISDEIDPRDIKQYCSEPSKAAGIIIGKVKERVGDLQKICTQFDDNESKCTEMGKNNCAQIGTARLKEESGEMEKLQAIAYSCPVNKNSIVQACVASDKHYMRQKIGNLAESCAKRFDLEGDRLVKECEKYKQNVICDKDKYMSQCMAGMKREDFQRSENEAINGFYGVKWECYDGSTGSGSDSMCRTQDYWSSYSKKACDGHCSNETAKCGVNMISVTDHCSSEKAKTECTNQEIPKCADGYSVQKKLDGNGCVLYYCELHVVSCPADVQQCSDGRYVKRVQPSCNFETCATQCPNPIAPSCAQGTRLIKKVDDKGCAYYYCESLTTNAQCKEISKPSCNSDEILQAYYDNTGCAISYQCIRQTTCGLVSKPVCAEGQSITTQVDDKGCVTSYECVTIKSIGSGSGVTVTGNSVMQVYDEMEKKCEISWLEQQRICINTPSTCDKDTFIDKCKVQEQKNADDFSSKIEQNCQVNTVSEIKYAEDRCARLDSDRQKCIDENSKRCSQMQGLSDKCIKIMTEENLREFIANEVRKRCKFNGLIHDENEVKKSENAKIILAVLNTATDSDLEKLNLFVEDLKEDIKLRDTTIYRGKIDPNKFSDIKLLPFIVNAKISASANDENSKDVKGNIVSGQKAENVAGKLVSLRDSDVPKEYLYIIENQATDVLNVSDYLGELEQKDQEKGVGYKLKRFFGLAKKAEQEEISQLKASKEKLTNSTEALTQIIEEVPSDVVKAVLKEQVANLKKQQDDIDVLIKSKEKKAKGLFGIFG